MNTKLNRFAHPLSLLAGLSCLLSLVPLEAGPIPFTQNQFPVWYAVGQSNVTTSTAETNLFQVAVPPSVLGNNGMMRLTYFFQKNDTTNTAIFTTYLGGTGNPPTGGVAINTNSLKASPTHSVVNGWLFTTAGTGGTNTAFIGTTTTNNFNGLTQVFLVPVVGTGTNGLNLTVTAQGDTNSYGLDAIIVEALAMP